jgi:hypothetical protein
MRLIHACAAMLTATVWLAALPAKPFSNDAQTVLQDRLDGSGFNPGGGLFYKKNDEQKAGSVLFNSPEKIDGRDTLALSVAPNCPMDDELCSERAEVWEKPEVLRPYGEPVWYGFSMKMAPPVPEHEHRYVMAQWKREIPAGIDGDYSPFLALRLIRGKLVITTESDLLPAIAMADGQYGCPDGQLPVNTKVDKEQTRGLAAFEAGSSLADYPIFDSCTAEIRQIARGGSLPKASSQWIDFAFLAKPGPAGDGRIEVFANGAWIVTILGKIGHGDPDLGANQYFKFGPYRAGRDDEWTINYANFRRGPRCSDVLEARLCP